MRGLLPRLIGRLLQSRLFVPSVAVVRSIGL